MKQVRKLSCLFLNRGTAWGQCLRSVTKHRTACREWSVCIECLPSRLGSLQKRGRKTVRSRGGGWLTETLGDGTHGPYTVSSLAKSQDGDGKWTQSPTHSQEAFFRNIELESLSAPPPPIQGTDSPSSPGIPCVHTQKKCHTGKEKTPQWHDLKWLCPLK